MIELDHITKIYPQSDTKALDGVSLEIATGEFFGLLGPNGAGKTTLISILATLLLPTEGEVRVDGQVLTRQRLDIKRRLSLITQHNWTRSWSSRGGSTPCPERRSGSGGRSCWPSAAWRSTGRRRCAGSPAA